MIHVDLDNATSFSICQLSHEWFIELQESDILLIALTIIRKRNIKVVADDIEKKSQSANVSR